MILIYALLVLLVTMLVAAITTLYNLTIQLFTMNYGNMKFQNPFLYVVGKMYVVSH